MVVEDRVENDVGDEEPRPDWLNVPDDDDCKLDETVELDVADPDTLEMD